MWRLIDFLSPCIESRSWGTEEREQDEIRDVVGTYMLAALHTCRIMGCSCTCQQPDTASYDALWTYCSGVSVNHTQPETVI